MRRMISVDKLVNGKVRVHVQMLVLEGEIIANKALRGFVAFDDAEFWTNFDESLSVTYFAGEMLSEFVHISKAVGKRVANRKKVACG